MSRTDSTMDQRMGQIIALAGEIAASRKIVHGVRTEAAPAAWLVELLHQGEAVFPSRGGREGRLL